MKAKTKNWIVFGVHIQAFAALTIITIFIELIWLFKGFFLLYEGFSPSKIHSYIEITIPSTHETAYSIIFILFMIINLTISTFSLYTFIFILHVLDSNPAKTAPICALALDCSLINIYLFHFSFYKSRYLTYLTPNYILSIYYHVLNFIAQRSEILMVLAFFTIAINFQFGTEGIYKSRIIQTNKVTDFVHILLILNGIFTILIISIYFYANILAVNLLGFILSLIIGLLFIGLFNFILRKKQLMYPIEAIAIWRHGKVITKNGKEKIYKVKK